MDRFPNHMPQDSWLTTKHTPIRLNENDKPGKFSNISNLSSKSRSKKISFVNIHNKLSGKENEFM